VAGDIFRAFVSMSGIYQAELALGFEVEDQSGAIGEVTAVIRAHSGRIVSILSGYERSPQGFLEVFIRAKDVKDEEALIKELKNKFKVTYVIHDKVD
jgi:acetoin utilization protein AcuB